MRIDAVADYVYGDDSQTEVCAEYGVHFHVIYI